MVWYQISVSMVPQETPPITSTTPKAVAQKRKVSAAPEAIAGARAGSVTVAKTRNPEAPRVRAASSARGSRRAQSVPTVRTTTE